MSAKTRLGLAALVAALLLGVLGDGLLRATPWGAGVGVWVAAVVAAGLAVARWQQVERGGGTWLLLPAVVFAGAVAWRDSPVLTVANLLAVLTCLAIAAGRGQAGRLHLAGATDFARDALVASFSASFGPISLCLGDVQWRELREWREQRRGTWAPLALAVLRGVLLAIPPLLVFGGLFYAADAVFAGIVADVFRLDLGALVGHVLFAGLWAWLVAGYLRQALLAPPAGPLDEYLPSRGPGAVEVGVVLGLLDALFLAFVLVQVRYLFGGAALVATSPTLTYAEYARRGFFELVAVAALALPLLLLADWSLRTETPTARRVGRALSGALLAMLFVVMASALERMRLYQAEFGLTELRLYTTAFMGWIALVAVWLAATVLWGRRERFAFGALVAGLAVLLGLNALDPDAYIAQVNLDRAVAGHRLDGGYLASLSGDAAPTLVARLADVPEPQRKLLAERLLERWSRPPADDWRAWRWGRAQAWRAVGEAEPELRGAAARR